jgi:molecular chaperone DnaK (HSP70)
MSVFENNGYTIFTTNSSKDRIPSLVCYNKDNMNEVFVGEEAENKFLHSSSKNFILISQAKRFIGLNIWDKEMRSLSELLNYDIVSDDSGRSMIRIRKFDEGGNFYDIYPQQGF